MLYSEKMKEICNKLGIDCSKLPNNLYSTLLDEICNCCGSGDSKNEPITITENGTYTAPEGVGYSPVEVNVFAKSKLKAYLDETKSAYMMFLKWSQPTTLDHFIDYNDTSEVTDMSYMFSDCSNLTNIPLMNTSKVTKMPGMFKSNKFTTIPLLDTSKVTDMSSMFTNCSKLTTIPQLDTSNVTNMYLMFNGCTSLTEIPALDTSNVTKMDSMFGGCTNLKSVPPLDTSKATVISDIFTGCSVLETIPLLDLRNSMPSSLVTRCTNLKNLTLKNIHSTLTIGSGTSWGHLLTLESLLNTCQECVNVNASKTLTVGSANLEKLSTVYVKLTGEAEEDETLPKLPMVQCESTDDGAMTIHEYMALKQWTLA